MNSVVAILVIWIDDSGFQIDHQACAFIFYYISCWEATRTSGAPTYGEDVAGFSNWSSFIQTFVVWDSMVNNRDSFLWVAFHSTKKPRLLCPPLLFLLFFLASISISPEHTFLHFSEYLSSENNRPHHSNTSLGNKTVRLWNATASYNELWQISPTNEWIIRETDRKKQCARFALGLRISRVYFFHLQITSFYFFTIIIIIIMASMLLRRPSHSMNMRFRRCWPIVPSVSDAHDDDGRQATTTTKQEKKMIICHICSIGCTKHNCAPSFVSS